MTTTPVRRVLRAIPALLLVLIPLRLAGQSAQQVQPQAAAATWADEVLKQESYAAAAEGAGGRRAGASTSQHHARRT